MPQSIAYLRSYSNSYCSLRVSYYLCVYELKSQALIFDSELIKGFLNELTDAASTKCSGKFVYYSTAEKVFSDIILSISS